MDLSSPAPRLSKLELKGAANSSPVDGTCRQYHTIFVVRDDPGIGSLVGGLPSATPVMGARVTNQGDWVEKVRGN